MNEELIIAPGTAASFKEIMQKSYDFLSTCALVTERCKVLEDLEFDMSLTPCIEDINTKKTQINGLYQQVTSCEDELIELDESSADKLADVFELDDEEKVEKEPVVYHYNYNDYNDYHNYDDYSPPIYYDDTPYDDSDQIFSSDDTGTAYKFSEDPSIAYQMGDIFINDNISLTKFTNDLLEKYSIQNEEVAKKIYEAVLIYGNEYYTQNHTNPINVLKEEEILDSLYELLKDICDYPKETFWDNLSGLVL